MNRLITIISIVLSFLLATSSFAKVYMTRDEALKLAFPGADRVEKKTVFLSEDQVKQIESLAKTRLKSKLYIFYSGIKTNRPLGYAVIDTHTLRTTTETIMVVINPNGTLRQAEILAFFEPTDYMPGGKWIALFHNKSVSNNSLRVGRDIPNITGATITSNAMAEAVRRTMAVFEVAIKGKNKLAEKWQN